MGNFGIEKGTWYGLWLKDWIIIPCVREGVIICTGGWGFDILENIGLFVTWGEKVTLRQ